MSESLKEKIDEAFISDFLDFTSKRGHLSNDQSAQTTLRLIESGVNKIQLCHLSNNNNTPSLALGRVQKAATDSGIIIRNEAQVKVNRRHEITTDTEF